MNETAAVPSVVPEVEAAPKICRACGRPNKSDAVRCVECNSDRFAPPWVRALRMVSRGFAVQVNEPHEGEDGNVPTLTFFKWWSGGRVSFHIREHKQWKRVKEIVDSELLQVLGWGDTPSSNGNGNGKASEQLVKAVPVEELLASTAPALAELANVDGGEMAAQGLEEIVRCQENTATWMGKLAEAHARAVRAGVVELPDDKVKAARQLGELASSAARMERAAAMAELRRRAAVLEGLGETLREARGYRVVKHRTAVNRTLEQALWVVDEAWWLGGDAEELRRSLDSKAEEEDKRYSRKPLDFAVGLRDGRLLVAKVLPPDKPLEPADLLALEEDVARCKEMAEVSSFEMVMVGPEITEELQKVVELRSDGTRVMTYDQLVTRATERCKGRLEQLGL